MRARAEHVIRALGEWGEVTIAHGSLARGDVDEHSDIDLLIQTDVSTQLIESRLLAAGFEALDREIAQATPTHSPKAHIYLDSEHVSSVTIPLIPLRRVESEFYRFGGAIGPTELRENIRVPGCTKRLTLVEPNKEGHAESSILGSEPRVASLLGVSLQIVRERVRVLERRDKVGRTGVFLRATVPDDSTFEEELSKQARENPALRRTLRVRGNKGRVI